MSNFKQELETFLQLEIANKMDNFSELNSGAKQKQIVFVGDSITEVFPLDELLESSKKIYKRGISGIQAKLVLENFDKIIGGLNPSEVFLLLGTNDLGSGQSPEQVANTIAQICQKLKAENSEVIIHLISIYPVCEGLTDMVGIRNNADIQATNLLLKEFAQITAGVTYHNLFSSLLDVSRKQLDKSYTNDGLHPNIEGYRVVSEQLTALLP